MTLARFREVGAKRPHGVGSAANSRCDSTRWADYERKKADWQQANPGATPAEYQAAMKRIATECGV